MPELPPEWGPIIIPDDASALGREAAALRKELRRDRRRVRWQRVLRLSTPRNRETPSLGVPLAIMAIAVVATLISLFAVAWPGGYDRGPRQPETVPTKPRPLTLPDLTLYDLEGRAVQIRDSTPAVLILVDGCRCERFIREIADLVDPRVSILVVSTPDPLGSASATPSAAASTPVPVSSISLRPGVRIRYLVDPVGELRAHVPGLPSVGTHGIALLVSSDWAVIDAVPTTVRPADMKADLERLAA